MTTSARYQKLVYLLLLLAITACAPLAKTPITAPNSEVKYENEVAVPTYVLPTGNSKSAVKYQPLAKKIINTSSSQKPVEIILGDAALADSKVSYFSDTRKMLLTGTVAIKNDRNEKIAEKQYSLSGNHESNQFILKEDTAVAKDAVAVSAQANCLSENLRLTDKNISDCNHVVLDVYISYNKKYYTEQIELNRRKPEPLPAPSETPAPQPSISEPKRPQVAIQSETEDHTQVQQIEESDESINGRYQGSAETIDLDKLFDKEVVEEKKEPVEIKPDIKPETRPEPIKPPTKPEAEPTPSPAPPLKKETPKPVIKEKILSPELKQTENGDVRPINQSFGFPDEGRLQNATSVLTRQLALSKRAFFEVVAPERNKHFSTYDMAEMITRGGDQLNKQYSKLLYVSNLSAHNGGVLSAVINGKVTQHASHQNGLDADLAYPTDVAHLKFPLVVRMKTNEYFPNNYSVEKTYTMLKFFYTQKDILVDRFFIDQRIKTELCGYARSKNEFSGPDKVIAQDLFENIQHVAGHGDHFHMRIKCSKSDPACRGRIYKKLEGCKSTL